MHIAVIFSRSELMSGPSSLNGSVELHFKPVMRSNGFAIPQTHHSGHQGLGEQ